MDFPAYSVGHLRFDCGHGRDQHHCLIGYDWCPRRQQRRRQQKYGHSGRWNLIDWWMGRKSKRRTRIVTHSSDMPFDFGEKLCCVFAASTNQLENNAAGWLRNRNELQTTGRKALNCKFTLLIVTASPNPPALTASPAFIYNLKGAKLHCTNSLTARYSEFNGSGRD